MSLCDLCITQVDRPGHFPPHPRLAKVTMLREAMRGTGFVYRCEACGQTLVLSAANEDAPDRWTLLDSPQR
ncbi:hypothetical protein AB4Z48_09540 [Cupriavidus sp. 2TAF22]|uniref:hypothetical protein n=1 Tax=unclassified Cupriavidus TaxID=2640874 RepID=UPI003F8ECA7B